MNPDSTQSCVTRNIEAEKGGLPKEIYLVPESDGPFGDYWAWCDVPDPTNNHNPDDSVRYVRADAQEN